MTNQGCPTRVGIRFDDGREQGQSATREAKQAEVAAKAAAKGAAEAVIRSCPGMRAAGRGRPGKYEAAATIAGWGGGEYRPDHALAEAFATPLEQIAKK